MALFIGGYARTGTTLMQGIICSDPAAFPVTQEASYLTALLHAYDHLLMLPKRIDDYFGTREHFTEYHRQTVTRYLDHICGRFGRDKLIVQKDPQLTLYFHHLAGFVARSRFIVMVRDPRAAVASQIRRKSQPGGPTRSCFSPITFSGTTRSSRTAANWRAACCLSGSNG